MDFIFKGLTLILFLPKFIYTIQLLELLIPHHAIRGSDVSLTCDYDLENESLYSVKWYKNGQEFYRYNPSDEIQRTVFKMNGIFVDRDLSTEKNVILRNVDLHTTGRYRCEVSGEAPLFHTAFKESPLIVFDLPDKGPSISGNFHRIPIGEFVEYNCTSSKSKPGAELKWYINGEQAEPSFTINYGGLREEATGYITNILGLKFKVKRKHFSKREEIKLKCTAFIESLYWKSSEETISGLKERYPLVSQDTKQRKSSFSTSHVVERVFHSRANSPWISKTCLIFISLFLLLSGFHGVFV